MSAQVRWVRALAIWALSARDSWLAVWALGAVSGSSVGWASSLRVALRGSRRNGRMVPSWRMGSLAGLAVVGTCGLRAALSALLAFVVSACWEPRIFLCVLLGTSAHWAWCTLR